MIIPNHHTNRDGDIVFELTHLSESKAESKKQPLDRKIYKNWITVNPLSLMIVKMECECVSFQFNGLCKHLKQSIKELEKFGVTYLTSKQEDQILVRENE